MTDKIVVWGLKSTRHSHRYIHDAFFTTLKRMSFEVYWLDDSPRNRDAIDSNTTVFAVDVASKYLPKNAPSKFVLHNLDPAEFRYAKKILNLQVFSKSSSGIRLSRPGTLFNDNSRTLYQPWGLPDLEQNLLQPSLTKSTKEYWVGAIWNNALNQGNKSVMDEYRSALVDHNIKLKRVGGTRWVTNKGISEVKMRMLINSSPIGASIVGNWQLENSYIPCRFFKNVASGAVPASNSDFATLLGFDGIYDQDIDVLVSKILNLSYKKRKDLVESAQWGLQQFTYQKNIRNILEFLNC